MYERFFYCDFEKNNYYENLEFLLELYYLSKEKRLNYVTNVINPTILLKESNNEMLYQLIKYLKEIVCSVEIRN